MATWSQLNFQDARSPLIEQLIFFHDYSIVMVSLITILVAYIILSLFINNFFYRFLLENQRIEIIWTIIPIIILIFITIPSLRLLYLLDENFNSNITIKTIGHQWYWSYEYSDFKDIEFDSYILPLRNTNINEFRLINVNNHIILPYRTQIRILITSSDVIHSWTIPTLGIKIDAIPGRLRQRQFLINRPGLYFGQCSEICGSNHRFIPIVIERISIKIFLKWINQF